MSEVYESKTPFTFKEPCKRCGQDFEQTLAEAFPREVCRDCSHKTPTALVRQSGETVKQGVVVPNEPEELLGRIKDLLLIASEPLVPRDRTFLERLFNEDPNVAPRLSREFAGQQVRELIQARHLALALTREECETKRFILRQEIEARLDVARAEIERRKLVREAEQLRADTERIEGERHLQRIEEAIKVTELLEGPPKVKQLNQAEFEIEKVRRRYRAKAEVDQALVSDFRTALANIVWSDAEEVEKVVRIHFLMDTYKVGEDGLPREVRKFVDRVIKEAPDHDD
jgi:hypothetical protein